MLSKGIRGATTVDKNTSESIKEATVELLTKMIDANNIEIDKISHVIFTTTSDINAEFPAKFARTELNWHNTAMMCYNEIPVPNALEKCLRVLIVVNTEENFKPEFIYLKGAKELRK